MDQLWFFGWLLIALGVGILIGTLVGLYLTRGQVSSYVEEFGRGEEETAKLSKELSGLKDRSLSLEGDLDGLRGKLKTETDLRAAAEGKVTASDKRAKDLEAELGTVRASLGEWESRHKAEVDLRAASDKKLTDVSKLKADADAELAKLRAGIGDWEKKFKAEAELRASADKKVGALSTDLDKLKGDLGALNTRLAVIPTLESSVSDWEGKFKAEANARAAADKKAADLNAQLEKLRGDLGALNTRVAVIPTLESSVSDWEGKFKAEADARAAADKKAADVNAQLEKLKGDLGALNTRVAVIPTLESSVSDWEGKFKAEASARAAADKKAADLAVELDKLKAELSGVSKRVAVIPTLETSVTDWEKKFKAEAEARAAATKKAGELEAELAKLRPQIPDWEKKFKAEAEARAASAQKVAELEAELARLRGSMGDWEGKFKAEAVARASADKRATDLGAELERLRGEVGNLNKRVTVIPTLETSVSDWESKFKSESGARVRFEGEATQLRDRVAVIERDYTARIRELEDELARLRAKPKVDNLELINGIGKVFAKKLNEAGIFSFEELARTAPDRIRDIIQPKSWQMIEPEKWVLESAAFAQGLKRA
jgi:chromosome segregation ATPase